LARIEAASENYLRTGATLFRPYHLTLLGRARSVGGDHEGALDALDAAAELADRNGELVHLPMILSERARILRTRAGNDAPAGVDDRRALVVADELGIDRRTLGLAQESLTGPAATDGAALLHGVSAT